MRIQKDDQELLAIRYKTYRKAVGITGMSLPFVLMFGEMIYRSEFFIRSSISDYYRGNMVDVFVGLLVAIGFFLLYYRYEKEDNIATNLAGICACGVAFFPASNELSLIRFMHFFSAGLLIACLAYICLKLFTLSDKDVIIGMKKKRNIIYKTCGWIIVVSLIMLLLYFIGTKVWNLDWSHLSFVFWMESIALVAFGYSWMIKGEHWFGDKSEN